LSKPGGKGGAGGLIVGGLIVTLAAAGGGAGLGFMLPVSPPPAETKKDKPAAEKPKAEEHATEEHSEEEAAHLIVQPLPPIVTNLASPPNTWLRLEASLLIDGEAKDEAEVLAAKLGGDIVAYLRTVALPQIEGASGYQHFRDDLHDLITTAGEGKVKQISVATMVVE
jgi:flagellar FliL protein